MASEAVCTGERTSGPHGSEKNEKSLHGEIYRGRAFEQEDNSVQAARPLEKKSYPAQPRGIGSTHHKNSFLRLP